MTVYVIQKQMRFSEQTGEQLPRFDTVDQASRWGEIKYLLSPSAHPFHPEGIINELQHKLDDYCHDDFIVPIGNPSIVGFAVAIAANANDGMVRILQWSGRDKDYVELPVRLY